MTVLKDPHAGTNVAVLMPVWSCFQRKRDTGDEKETTNVITAIMPSTSGSRAVMDATLSTLFCAIPV